MTRDYVFRMIAPSDWRSQPWKNGLGVTHEVWRSPDHDDYDIRVSVAEDTTPAPFSRFPGYHRWTVLIEPAPITLVIDGVTRELARIGEVVDHDGSAVVESIALPTGPTKLLNVLAKPGWRVGVGTTSELVRFAFLLDGVSGHLQWYACDYYHEPAPAPEGRVMWIAPPL